MNTIGQPREFWIGDSFLLKPLDFLSNHAVFQMSLQEIKSVCFRTTNLELLFFAQAFQRDCKLGCSALFLPVGCWALLGPLIQKQCLQFHFCMLIDNTYFSVMLLFACYLNWLHCKLECEKEQCWICAAGCSLPK